VKSKQQFTTVQSLCSKTSVQTMKNGFCFVNGFLLSLSCVFDAFVFVLHRASATRRTVLQTVDFL